MRRGGKLQRALLEEVQVPRLDVNRAGSAVQSLLWSNFILPLVALLTPTVQYYIVLEILRIYVPFICMVQSETLCP